MGLYVQLPDRQVPGFDEGGQFRVRSVPGLKLPVLDDAGDKAGDLNAGRLLGVVKQWLLRAAKGEFFKRCLGALFKGHQVAAVDPLVLAKARRFDQGLQKHEVGQADSE